MPGWNHIGKHHVSLAEMTTIDAAGNGFASTIPKRTPFRLLETFVEKRVLAKRERKVD
jgi:hypothetical protein